MTDYNKIYDGISKAIWGYFFLYFNINFNIGEGSVSIIPSFVGYIFFLKVIDLLKDEEQELSLLRTLGIVLAVWNVVEWFADCIAYNFGGQWQFVTLITGLVNLYFHFQFITNLASIARKYQQDNCIYDKDLLTCRTVQTILQTFFLIVSNLNYNFSFALDEVGFYATIILTLCYFIFLLGIVRTLVQLRKHLKSDGDFEDEIVTTE